MKFEIIPKDPDQMYEENLVLDGRVIGWVKTKKDEGALRCHVGLNFPDHLYWNLIQGHGPTTEMAIFNAIDEARLNLTGLLKAIDIFHTDFLGRDL